VETIENIFRASYKNGEQKIIFLEKASSSFDALKFLLQVAWETEIIQTKRYIALSEKLSEIGRMLGGWHKKTTAPHIGGATEQR